MAAGIGGFSAFFLAKHATGWGSGEPGAVDGAGGSDSPSDT